MTQARAVGRYERTDVTSEVILKTGGSRWFLHHADEHMKVLMDPQGPFEHLQNSEADFTYSTQPLAWCAPKKDDVSSDADEL